MPTRPVCHGTRPGFLKISPGTTEAALFRENHGKWLKGLVGARGFEPPASWSRTMNTRIFKHLALGTVGTNGFALLRVIKQFRDADQCALAMLRNASMQRVGTKMGTLFSAPNVE